MDKQDSFQQSDNIDPQMYNTKNIQISLSDFLKIKRGLDYDLQINIEDYSPSKIDDTIIHSETNDNISGKEIPETSDDDLKYGITSSGATNYPKVVASSTTPAPSDVSSDDGSSNSSNDVA